MTAAIVAPFAVRRRSRVACAMQTFVSSRWIQASNRVRIAEALKITPGDHQRVLQGMLGPIDVPEDPTSDREEPVTVRVDQVHEGLLVAALRRLYEIAIHRSTSVM